MAHDPTNRVKDHRSLVKVIMPNLIKSNMDELPGKGTGKDFHS